MAIRYEHGGQTILRQLSPKMVGMSGNHLVHTVSQMSAEGRPCVDRVPHLLRTRRTMAEGDAYSHRDSCSDVLTRPCPFRRECHDAYKAAGHVLPPFELGWIRVAQMTDVMSATGPILLRERRALDMNTRDAMSKETIGAASLSDHREHMEDLLLIGCDHRRQIRGHALCPHRMREFDDRSHVDVVCIDIEPGESVDL